MSRITPVLSMICLLGSLAYCGSSTNNSASGGGQAGGTPSSQGADTQAAQQASDSASDASATDALGGSRSSSMMAMLAAERAFNLRNEERALNTNGTASFTFDGCQGEVAYSVSVDTNNATTNATETFSNSNCTGLFQLAGTQNITIVANVPNSQRTTTVTSDITTTVAKGDTIALSTLDTSLGYTYKLVATGNQLGGGDVNVLVSLNEHRVRSAADANVEFDHEITTTADGVLVVASFNTDSSAKSRTISSGEIDVHHKLAKFKAQHTFNNLVQAASDSNCYCPSSGSINQVVTADSNDWTYTRVYAFTGCGQISVTTNGSTKAGTENGTAQITWAGCTKQ